MNLRHRFPLGKAYGEAFYNHLNETKKLVGNIESGKHTFLVAPRRYGKSSLCQAKNSYVVQKLIDATTPSCVLL